MPYIRQVGEGWHFRQSEFITPITIQLDFLEWCYRNETIAQMFHSFSGDINFQTYVPSRHIWFNYTEHSQMFSLFQSTCEKINTSHNSSRWTWISFSRKKLLRIVWVMPVSIEPDYVSRMSHTFSGVSGEARVHQFTWTSFYCQEVAVGSHWLDSSHTGYSHSHLLLLLSISWSLRNKPVFSTYRWLLITLNSG